MKTTKIISFWIVIALLLFTSVKTINAAGTPAGTSISNFATINYKDIPGNAFPSFNSNTVTVIVAQKAGVAISPVTASSSSGDSSYEMYPVTVTNTGNGTDIFDLTINSSNSWTPRLYRDANRDGVLQPSEILAGTVSATSNLPADSSYYLIARIFVPDNTPSNTQDVLTVTATSQYANTVFATGTFTTTVSTAVLVMTKTQSNSNPQPGQTVTYTIGYHNTGTSRADSVIVTDVVNTNLTFVNASIVVSTGAGLYVGGTRTLTWTVGNVLGGASGTMSFQVTVNAGVPYGTVINDQGLVAYKDSANGVIRTGTTPTTSLSVAQILGGTLTVTPESQTIDVGLQVVYALTGTNTGNGTDSARITVSSTEGYVWTFWMDVNNDGIPGNSGDYIINLNNTGPLLQNAVTHALAVTTIPSSTEDNHIDTSRFSFISFTDPTHTPLVIGVYTTQRAPQLSLVKSVTVLGGGPSAPGATLVYTLTYHNYGTGAATGVSVSDHTPANTTYITNSVKHNGVTKTDAIDGDEVQVINGDVIVFLGMLGANSTGTFEFRVTIN